MTLKWTYSNGVFVCNELSAKLRYAALINTRILQFAKARFEPDPLIYDRFRRPRLRRLRMKVSEIGRGISINPMDVKKSLCCFDPSNPIQKKLIEQLSGILDSCSASALKMATLEVKTIGLKKLFPKARWTKLDRLLSASLGYLSYITEPYEPPWYIGIAGPRFAEDIVKLKHFRRWQEYLEEGDVLFEGEIGETPKMRWVKCTNMHNFLPGEAVMFGEDGLSMVETQTPELRMQDMTIAWFGVLAFGGQNVLHIPEKRK